MAAASQWENGVDPSTKSGLKTLTLAMTVSGAVLASYGQAYAGAKEQPRVTKETKLATKPAPKADQKPEQRPAGKPDGKLKDTKIEKGAHDHVVCIRSETLALRTDDLGEVIVRAKRHEPVKIFQGWGDNKQSKKIKGETYTFIKVQLPEHEDEDHEGIGWVAEKYVKTRSQCSGASETREKESVAEQKKPKKAAEEVDHGKAGGSCRFPLTGRPTADYTSGMRRFGASRNGGARLHAASDLYRKKNDPILSVTEGRVLRRPYYFYEGTYAIEVKHAPGFVVRYGEVTGNVPKGTYEGAQVRKGQTIAYMGKVNSGCCSPMLHFEMYSGKKSGSLRGGNAYQRRSDLVNPAKFLQRWEQETF